MRGLFWLTTAEAARLRTGLSATKWGYEARSEVSALLPLIAGPILLALYDVGLGLAYLWLCKAALQALIHKGFFDPRP